MGRRVGHPVAVLGYPGTPVPYRDGRPLWFEAVAPGDPIPAEVTAACWVALSHDGSTWLGAEAAGCPPVGTETSLRRARRVSGALAVTSSMQLVAAIAGAIYLDETGDDNWPPPDVAAGLTAIGAGGGALLGAAAADEARGRTTTLAAPFAVAAVGGVALGTAGLDSGADHAASVGALVVGLVAGGIGVPVAVAIGAGARTTVEPP